MLNNKFEKIDVARHLLTQPGADAVGECLDKIRSMGEDKQVLAEMLLRALVALGKRELKDTNEKNKRDGDPGNWPAGQGWKDMGGTSHSIFLHRVREEAGIDTKKYLDIIRNDTDIDVEELWNELC